MVLTHSPGVLCAELAGFWRQVLVTLRNKGAERGRPLSKELVKAAEVLLLIMPSHLFE